LYLFENNVIIHILLPPHYSEYCSRVAELFQVNNLKENQKEKRAIDNGEYLEIVFLKLSN